MDTKYKIERCLEALEDVPSFNCAFLNSVLNSWYTNHEFTPAQQKAVNNIFYRYKVNKTA